MNKPSINSNWLPTGSIENLKKRSQILAKIRQFFAEHNVWEIETPLLGNSTATDPHIYSLTIARQEKDKPPIYLQTSPEFPMKRLLAAGSGSIYQITKAFRGEEKGRLHNTEFTMLEWYRVGFDHHQLMDEMDALLKCLLNTPAAERLTYTAAFKIHTGIDPLMAQTAEFENCAQQHGLTTAKNSDANDVDFWRHLLMSHLIEPQLGKDRPTFIFDFPASQAALARIRNDHPPVAERFEVYFRGIELANGYHELNDAKEQKKRFLADNERRRILNLPQIPLDEYLLAALAHGLPDCAGVALGVDRLIMLALNASTIEEVSF